MTFSPLDPKVSIVIPVYNGANYLREAIESAINQTYQNVEVIVVNDGSNDDGATEAVALSFGNCIRYFKKDNGGVASALNAGIRLMTGEYLSWLSHDDVYFPCKISEQIACLCALGKNVMLYSDYEVIDSSSRIVRTVSIKRYPSNEIRRALVLDYPIQGCSALIPKEFFDRVGFFDESLKTTQDYDMWFRIANCYDVVHMPITLIKSREHPEQGTHSMTSLHFIECNDFCINSMMEVAAEIGENGSAVSNNTFIAECLLSFSMRGFHRASRVALLQYIKSIFIDKTSLTMDTFKPIAYFININIRRLINILPAL